MKSIKKSKDTMKMRKQYPKVCGKQWNSPKREIHSITGLYQEARKSQVNDLTLHLKELEKEQYTKIKVNRRKEIVKARA